MPRAPSIGDCVGPNFRRSIAEHYIACHNKPVKSSWRMASDETHLCEEQQTRRFDGPPEAQPPFRRCRRTTTSRANEQSTRNRPRLIPDPNAERYRDPRNVSFVTSRFHDWLQALDNAGDYEVWRNELLSLPSHACEPTPGRLAYQWLGFRSPRQPHSRGADILSASSAGVSPARQPERRGQDARGTRGRDAHATMLALLSSLFTTSASRRPRPRRRPLRVRRLRPSTCRFRPGRSVPAASA